MKVVICLFALCAIATAAEYYGNQYGKDFFDYPTDVANAYRQKKVNAIADSIGAGTGTARTEGVPGTVLDKNRGYGYGYGYNGYQGYNDYNKYGYQPYGYGAYY